MKLLIMVLIIAAMPIAAAQIDKEQASNLISQAEKDMEELLERGFGVSYVNDTLKDAKDAFKAENYALVHSKTNEITKRKERAYTINDSLRVLNQRMEELSGIGLDVTEARELFILTQKTFRNELYEDTETLISRVAQKLDEAEAESSTLAVALQSARDNIVFFVVENKYYIIAALILISISGFIAYRRIMLIKLRNKLADAKLEEAVLKNLINGLQVKYAKEGSIPKEEYDLATRKYRERIMQIRREVPALKDNITKTAAFAISLPKIKPTRLRATKLPSIRKIPHLIKIHKITIHHKGIEHRKIKFVKPPIRKIRNLFRVPMPKVSLPRISLPKVTLPKVSVPKVKLPKIPLPRISLPKLTFPKVPLPKKKIRLPKTKVEKKQKPQKTKITVSAKKAVNFISAFKSRLSEKAGGVLKPKKKRFVIIKEELEEEKPVGKEIKVSTAKRAKPVKRIEKLIKRAFEHEYSWYKRLDHKKGKKK